MADYLYKGVTLRVEDYDSGYKGYFEAASQHRLAVQKCKACGLMRWEPCSGCPWCASQDWDWQQVSGKGIIYSYQIVAAAKYGPFADWGDYPVVIVELDEQQGQPTAGEALRMIANLVDENFKPEKEENVAIGKRVEAVFMEVGEGFALPQFRLASEPPRGKIWQFKGR